MRYAVPPEEIGHLARPMSHLLKAQLRLQSVLVCNPQRSL
jgi:hypothetical protein